MHDTSCERCGGDEPLPVGDRCSLCEDCVCRALVARFPIYGLTLDELATALRRQGSRRARRRVLGV